MPLPLAALLIPGAITAIGGMIGGKKRRADQRNALAEYNSKKQDYLNMDTSNPYADVKNQFSENVYEDLEVNTQQADFMAEQGAQSRANIMDSLSGAAGSSGVAGLAQSLANSATQANQQASASIGQQEAANQKLAAQGQLQVQQGEMQADMTRRKGEVYSRGLEQDRTKTLLGMSQTRLREANQARQAARDQIFAGIGQMGSAMMGGVDAGMHKKGFFTGKD